MFGLSLNGPYYIPDNFANPKRLVDPWRNESILTRSTSTEPRWWENSRTTSGESRYVGQLTSCTSSQYCARGSRWKGGRPSDQAANEETRFGRPALGHVSHVTGVRFSSTVDSFYYASR